MVTSNRIKKNDKIGNVLLAALFFCLVVNFTQAAELEKIPYANPVIQNMTGHYETILFSDEQIKLFFRLRLHGNIPFREIKSETIAIQYDVYDFNNKLVTQGHTSTIRLFRENPAHKPGVMIDLELPKEQQTGWFRVYAKIVAMDKQGKQRVFGQTYVDLAIVPPLKQDNHDRYFGLSSPFGAGQPTPPLTEYTLPMIEMLGVKSLRVFTNWPTIQATEKGPFDFRRLDRFVKVAKHGDIQVMFTLSHTPKFAAEPIPTGLRVPLLMATPKPAMWEKFVRKMVHHFRGRVLAWEVLNETNGARQWPNGNPRTYASFLAKTYPMIKQEDPDALVSMAGTTGIKAGWTKNMANSGAAKSLEIIAIHPYRYHLALPEIGTAKLNEGYGKKSLIDDLKSLKKVMEHLPLTQSGFKRELWSTESGYNTTPHFPPPLHHAISEVDHANLLVRTMIIGRAEGVARFFWWRPYDTLGAGFGLLRNQDYDFMPKPAFVAYAVLQRQLAGAKEVKLCDNTPAAEVYLCKATFVDSPTVHVLWTVRKKKQVTIQASSPIVVTDLMGVSKTLTPKNNQIKLTIGPSAIYLKNIDRITFIEK